MFSNNIAWLVKPILTIYKRLSVSDHHCVQTTFKLWF